MRPAQRNCLEKAQSSSSSSNKTPKNPKEKKKIKDDVLLLEERDLPFWSLHPFLSGSWVTWDCGKRKRQALGGVGRHVACRAGLGMQGV